MSLPPELLEKNIDAKKLQQAWENAREIIRNENDLIHHRMTYLLTLQGLLFTALGVLASGFCDPTKNNKILFLGLICIVTFIGYLSSEIIKLPLRAARNQILSVKLWWKKFYINSSLNNNENYRDKFSLPILAGDLKQELLRDQYRDLLGFSDEEIDEILSQEDQGIHKLIDFLQIAWIAIFLVLVISLIVFYVFNGFDNFIPK